MARGAEGGTEKIKGEKEADKDRDSERRERYGSGRGVCLSMVMWSNSERRSGIHI